MPEIRQQGKEQVVVTVCQVPDLQGIQELLNIFWS